LDKLMWRPKALTMDQRIERDYKQKGRKQMSRH
jgi:hypothetical protein